MRETLADRVLTVVDNEYPLSLTNRQIADRLQAPEPSVRRATLTLWDQRVLDAAGTCPLTYAKCYRRADAQL